MYVARRSLLYVITMALPMKYIAIYYLCRGMATAAAFRYMEYAKGVIVSPHSTFEVRFWVQCSATCRKMRVCSAFSTVGPSSYSGLTNCSIALGDFTWVDDPNASLFLEDIGQDTGYTLLKDGRFYKYATAAPTAMTILQATLVCNAQGGHLPVPYPKERRDVISAFAPTDKALGFHTANASLGNGIWTAHDGVTFGTNRSDPSQQPWQAGRPVNTASRLCAHEANGTWRDISCRVTITTRVLCQRGLRYEQSPSNGKYYKLHLTTPAVNHDQAENVCISEGGTLANAYGQVNWAGIAGPRAAVDMHAPLSGSLSIDRRVTSFHIGGTDEEEEGIWKMPDGSSFNLADRAIDPYQRWIPGEPNNTTDVNFLLYCADGFGFADIPPTVAYSMFLCEIVI